MSFEEILSILKSALGEDIFVEVNDKNIQPFVIVTSEKLISVTDQLYQNPQLFFDFLSCISAVDNGVEKNTLEVVYHFNSIPFGHQLIVKVILNREIELKPSVPSITCYWKGANWHEREIAEMFGIHFENHPDLRKLLLPNDWIGYPLRKDYTPQENYHGIKVAY